MKVVVTYDSLYGNTEKIAHATPTSETSECT
jgi:hypothetical protein